MTNLGKYLAMLSAVGLAACVSAPGRDVGLGAKNLSDLKATIWTDPSGCQHWVIDDGGEGYMTIRRSRDGRPICGGSKVKASANTPRIAMKATLWTDARGCQHWVVDDGGEGFMSERLSRDGRPVCNGKAAKTSGKSVTLSADALFASGSARLRRAAVAKLDAFGRDVKRLGKKRVFIVGHTDSRSSDVYNQRLSERRAASVASFLARRHGIRSKTVGRGEREPVATNATAAGRQANRRVVISIVE